MVVHHLFRSSAILFSRNQALCILLPSLEMEKEKNQSLNALKMERWREEKEAKKEEADRDYYRRNRDCKIAKVQEGRRKLQKQTPVETRQVMKARAHKTKGAQRKKEAREMAKQKRDKIRQQT